jgi:hypothetical protein
MPMLSVSNDDLAAIIKFLESQDHKMTAGGVVGATAKTQPEPEKASK